MQNYSKLEKDHKARKEEAARLTNMMAIVVWKWLPAPKHVQPCVECGGWGEGWVMSQSHMLASVPDLLVSPVRHVARQGDECSCLLCVCL